MESPKKPELDLARKVLPEVLLESLAHVFEQGPIGCVLAGGSALAGFYAGHRRSDDMDLFTSGERHQTAAVLAVESLRAIGVSLSDPFRTAQFFRVVCNKNSYRFTATAVVDENLFRVGRIERLENGICVADLATLLKMKIATLASHSSEKDLYDLIWLFGQFGEVDIAQLIALGRELDGGFTGETLLLGVSGAPLKEESCDFSLDVRMTKKDVFKLVTAFREKLLREISAFLHNQPAPPLGRMIAELRRLQTKKTVKA